jgi:hypothetical protein
MEEMSAQASVESTETTQAASGDAGSPQTSLESSTSAESSETPSGSPEAVQAPYTPSLKYKAMGKEYEMDPWIKDAIKAKEHEDKIRELYEKATGLDAIKTEREKLREEYFGYKDQWEPVKKELTRANEFYSKAKQAFESGDSTQGYFHMDSFLKHIGVPKKLMQQYVLQDLQMEDLPQEQKAAYNKNRELESQYQAMQERLSQTEMQYQQMAVEQKRYELHSAMSKPDVQSLQQAFDQRNGQGSFQQEIIRRGQWYEASNQPSPTADQLVQEMVKLYGFQMQASQPQTQQASQGPNKELPVIPVVKGGSSSPTTRSLKTLADLEAVRKEKYGY